ncbi:MAG: hypothetical protein B0D92_02785 [Spirochaeta sp. LUC14_002_19_P3]|nr:MAG: hypothetical protein B0D92_02785 [Spirochaeta sp. LUC14_002_19_P3]
MGMFRLGVFTVLGMAVLVSAMAESVTQVNMELYNSAYRGRGEGWYYGLSGLADLRFVSAGNKNMKAQAALEFSPRDVSSGLEESAPMVSLKRLWFKANFPSWRLTAGKTKVAWGNGFVYNSGDVLFGSLSPNLDLTQSAFRDDTAFLMAFNVPLGRFSYLEAVVLPPELVYANSRYEVQSIDKISGGMRFFFPVGGFRLEGGYIYKGDKKTAYDMLGHRPYLSFHGHVGVDVYGAVSLAAGYDSTLSGDDNRDTWEEISRTVNFSLGLFHQFQVGLDGTLGLRFEALVMPWQEWSRMNFTELTAGSGLYGIMIYPEVSWNFRSAWTVSLRSLISPVDGSARLTAGVNWQVFQGFTLMGYVTANIGGRDALFAWDRSTAWPFKGTALAWPDYSFNGFSVTLGGKYSY